MPAETPAEAETLRAAIRIMRRYRGGLATTIAVLEETADLLDPQNDQ